MKTRYGWVNPLDFKWSGTVKMDIYSTKQEQEWRQAITPVIVVRDTPEARKALGLAARSANKGKETQ